MTKHLAQSLLLGFIYVVMSLIIGEVHPFTLVPMYNYFPNYAYSYYLSDNSGKLLPIGQYFKYNVDNLSHNFNAICQSKNIPNGFQMETERQLSEVGHAMMSQMMEYRYAPLPAVTVQLHRVCYYMGNDTIAKKDIVMYETAVQP